MNKKHLYLIVTGMVCVVLIMGVYGGSGSFGNPFGSWPLGTIGTSPSPTPSSSPNPIPSAGPVPAPTATPSPSPYPSYTPYPSPTPAPYVIHLYVEWTPDKYSDYVVSILIAGEPDDLVTVWAHLEGESDALLFTEMLDEYGVYTTSYDVGAAGTWVFWAESDTGLSDDAIVVIEEGEL